MTVPRTLIVSEAPFGLDNGFGVTLTTLFSGWPADRLRLFHTRAARSEPLRDICDRMAFADVPGHQGRRYALACLAGYRPAWRGRYSRAWLARRLGAWRPDLVYTLVFSAETLAYAAWIARRLQVPLVAHVADDGIEQLRSGVPQRAGELLKGASVRISISEEMRQEYLRRYGVDSHVLHNGAAEDLFTRAKDHGGDDAENRGDDAESRGRDDVCRVRYLGSLVPSIHLHAFEDVVEAVRRLRRGGTRVRLEIAGGSWTRQQAEQFVDGDAVVYHGDLSAADGHAFLASADLLVVTASFDPAALAQSRLSLPTKLTECLASGAPTLVYGPAGCGPMEFCRRHGVGSIIDGRSVDAVMAFIRGIVADRGAARTRAAHDREFIRREYSATAVRSRFVEMLSSAQGTGVPAP